MQWSFLYPLKELRYTHELICITFQQSFDEVVADFGNDLVAEERVVVEVQLLRQLLELGWDGDC